MTARPVTDGEIASAFEAAEKAAGGPQQCDAEEVLRKVAADLGVTFERARDAMLWQWGHSG